MSDLVFTGKYWMTDAASTVLGDYVTSKPTVELHPSWGITENHIIDMNKSTAITGRLYSYKASANRKYSYSIPVDFLTNSEMLQINEWWLNQTECYFTSDEANIEDYPSLDLNNTITTDTTLSADKTYLSPLTVNNGVTLTVNNGITMTVALLISYSLKGYIVNKTQPISRYDTYTDDTFRGVIMFRSSEDNPTRIQTGE